MDTDRTQASPEQTERQTRRKFRKSRYDQLAPEGPTDLSAERLRRTARIERSRGDDGRETLTAIFPNLAGPAQLLNLTAFLDFPNLVEPLADAVLRYAMGETSNGRIRANATRAAFVTCLATGFLPFLKENGEIALGLDQIDRALTNRFVRWLNRTGSGKAVLMPGSRAQRLSALSTCVALWRISPRWNSQISTTLHLPNNPWPGRHRQITPTLILDGDAFSAVYRACVEEVVETIKFVERGREAAAAARDRIPAAPRSQSDYADRAICLAALDRAYPGVIPKGDAVRKDNSKLGDAIKTFHNYTDIVDVFYPSPRRLVPFVLLLGIHFCYNLGTALKSQIKDFTRTSLLGEERIRGAAYKGRSGREQRRNLPATDDPDNPARLLTFLKRWTERIRPLAPPHLRDRVFLFVPARGLNRGTRVTGYTTPDGVSSNDVWKHNLIAFARDHGLAGFTFRQIRHTVLDLAHELFVGDLRALQALGGQRDPQTILSHYTSDAARRRNNERLAEALELRNRHVTDKRIDARRACFGEDVGCATPGWRCADPYDSSRTGQTKEKLCAAYGECPACALAQIDFRSATAYARAIQLDERISQAQAAMDPAQWLKKWAPVQERLRQFWLPRFPKAVIREAATLSPRPLSIPKVE